jgi:hypothetical protein
MGHNGALSQGTGLAAQEKTEDADIKKVEVLPD